MRFVMPGLSAATRGPRARSPSAPSGTSCGSRPGSSRRRTVPWGVPLVVDIRFVGSCRSMIRPPTSGKIPCGTTNVSPKRALKRSAMSRASSMCWRWSSPTGTASVWYSRMSPAISTGYVNSPDGDELALVRLLLELRHPAELPVARDGREQPARLGVRRDLALREDGRPLRVEPGRDQHREQVERALAEVLRVVLHRDRVEVDDAEVRLAELLRLRVLAEPADVVAEGLVARRLDAREDLQDGPFARFATEGLERPAGRRCVMDARGARRDGWRSMPGMRAF